MKKALSLFLLLIFAICFAGCGNDGEISGPSGKYFKVYVCDLDRNPLDNDFTVENSSFLSLKETYLLEVLLAPGAGLMVYEGLNLNYNADEIEITTVEGYDARYYNLRGLRECINSTVELSGMYAGKYPISKTVYLSFN